MKWLWKLETKPKKLNIEVNHLCCDSIQIYTHTCKTEEKSFSYSIIWIQQNLAKAMINVQSYSACRQMLENRTENSEIITMTLHKPEVFFQKPNSRNSRGLRGRQWALLRKWRVPHEQKLNRLTQFTLAID